MLRPRERRPPIPSLSPVAPAARPRSSVLCRVVLLLFLSVGLVSGLQAEEAARPPGSPLPRELHNSLGMEFVLIEAGTFAMGAPPPEPGRFDDETLHQVTLSQPFYLGKYEVTQAQWQAVMGRNPSHFSACGGTCPVERISWEDTQAFITALNAREGGAVYRLPTEAEWEYAARAGTQTAYHFGDDAARLEQYGWYADNSGGRSHPVGQKQPNAWGVFDMHGNVWEWVHDGDGAYPTGAVTDPRGPRTESSHRVIRGGGWRSTARGCRAAFRYYALPDEGHYRLGVRLARRP